MKSQLFKFIRVLVLVCISRRTRLHLLKMKERFASYEPVPIFTEKIHKSVKQKRAGLNSGKMGEIMRKYGAEASEGGMLQVIVE